MSEGWVFDKRVSIGHIVTTAVVAVSAMMWLGNVDRRISVLEEIVQQYDARFERNDARWTLELNKIQRILERIDAKLDRKVDR